MWEQGVSTVGGSFSWSRVCLYHVVLTQSVLCAGSSSLYNQCVLSFRLPPRLSSGWMAFACLSVVCSRSRQWHLNLRRKEGSYYTGCPKNMYSHSDCIVQSKCEYSFWGHCIAIIYCFSVTYFRLALWGSKVHVLYFTQLQMWSGSVDCSLYFFIMLML